MLAFVVYQFFQSRRQPRDIDQVVKLGAMAKATITTSRLRSFERIHGFNYLVAAASADESYSGGLSEKEFSALRNYLFLNIQDMSSRWLLPNNDKLIVSMK